MIRERKQLLLSVGLCGWAGRGGSSDLFRGHVTSSLSPFPGVCGALPVCHSPAHSLLPFFHSSLPYFPSSRPDLPSNYPPLSGHFPSSLPTPLVSFPLISYPFLFPFPTSLSPPCTPPPSLHPTLPPSLSSPHSPLPFLPPR